ncbi:hypothetical protein N7509_004456 [Penicillium cosmopolitanum]|uniref:Aminotransferase class I/classII large domain-containing protein n=1 Tax=Penicillium cosmopolitanum TaxID=1131564 RepID=A0A9W9W706_9EURO|nr:uncharacterized protein N7509_004456 [Penicillium cosmopolitanum]KAJ5404585.1 hypothetical protein N7509_004456 [Penicillium cosmopolitanum]
MQATINSNDSSAPPVTSDFRLSQRGATNFAHRDVWGPREKTMGNPWSPNNPNGITGPRGSRRLRHAAAELLNHQFGSRSTITYDNIIVTPGCASAIDALAFSICDEGEGVLIPQPLYNGFNFDLLNRSNVHVVGVKYEGVEGYTGINDLFQPEVNKVALKAALSGRGRMVLRSAHFLFPILIIPLGDAIPPETLKEFAAFCGDNNLHFISDEIYAFSVFSNPAIPAATSFTSVLSLDLDNIIDPTRMHVLYGASKDFCANGLRMGFVCSKNEGIIGSMSSIGIFSWSPHVLQDAWAAMLEDQLWLDRFMTQKKARMLNRYQTISGFLSQHGIPYFDMNAGLFLWVDLRHLLGSKSSVRHSDYGPLKATSPDAHSNLKLEQDIADICMKNGVMIAPGHVYMAEEYEPLALQSIGIDFAKSTPDGQAQPGEFSPRFYFMEPRSFSSYGSLGYLTIEKAIAVAADDKIGTHVQNEVPGIETLHKLHALLSWSRFFEAVALILMIVALATFLLSPYLTRLLYRGKFWGSQAWLFGFEGYADLETIESQIFGARMRRLRWSPYGSSLSRHDKNDSHECVGQDPIKDPIIRTKIEQAARNEASNGMRIFTLVDTNTMTVTLFEAARPPSVLLLCAVEVVLRLETPVLEKMSRVSRVKLGAFRKQESFR